MSKRKVRPEQELARRDVVVTYKRTHVADTIQKFNETPLRSKSQLLPEVEVIRVVEGPLQWHGKFWLMRTKAKGWASAGMGYPSIEVLMSQNDIVIVRAGVDSVSHYYECRAAREGERCAVSVMAAE